MSNVGKATQMPKAPFRVCISGADQGGVDDGCVKILGVIRCLWANTVDEVQTNLEKNKGG
jgi:hypothetical protein